jgi:DNA excision repair protein ERCC-2
MPPSTSGPSRPTAGSPDTKQIYTVRVRELVEFVHRRGNLGGTGEFAGSDRALAGIRGHQKLQFSRPAGYKKEVTLSHDLEHEQFRLRIQGRLDGLLPTEAGIVLEEIKTVHTSWNRTADPLHWAQAKCYGYIYAHDHGLDHIVLQLTYVELDTGAVTEFREHLAFSDLKDFFTATTDFYLTWIQAHHEWRRKRDESIRSLVFPHQGFRPGQRRLAVAVYRSMTRGERLFVEAPTGSGKTISALFPTVKALGEGELKQIFFLTARTIGRTIAEKAFNDMRASGLQLRALTLTARDKICVRDGQPCDKNTCPLALGYYDRCHPAIRAALDHAGINRTLLDRIGQEHQVCPHELALDVSLWVDAVVCDYNYVFDPQTYLRRHFGEPGGDYGFLVDEAHNLVDRAREMFSAELDSKEIQDVKRAVRNLAALSKALGKLNTALRRLAAPATAPDEFQFDAVTTPDRKPQRADAPNNIQTHAELPAGLLPLLEECLKEAERWLVKNQPAEFRGELLDFYFRLSSFRRVAELYDEHFATLIESAGSIRLRLYCLDPSVLLRRALERGKAAVFFSATLTPVDYYRVLLGGSPEDPTLQLPSAFPPENLAVLIHDRIQTHFKARDTSLGDVAQAIKALIQERAGNYLVYFPSYQYLRAVHEQFQGLDPAVSTIVQSPSMTEAGRETFLAAFDVPHGKTLVGFAVLGGVFGEGIDLTGERLIGAIIVGVGLPQMSVERDLIREYFEERNGEGFNYAYTFPGMNRVLQAVGRVIRSENDRGVVLLIDQRFGETRYRRLLPGTWETIRVRNIKSVSEAVHQFWDRKP